MNVRRQVLDNGLTVLTEKIPHVRSVSLGFWIKSGSRHERADQNGISHFLEHLLFKGTHTRSAQQIAMDIDSIGGQLDAFTSREYVGFYAKVLDENLRAAFDLLSEIVLHPCFPPDEVERERNVICEEINMTEDAPSDLVHDMFMQSFWRGHPLGRPISGTKKIIRSLSRGRIAGYFRRVYSPANMLVVAAGHLRHEQIVERAARAFSDRQGSANGFPSTPPRVHRTFRVKNKQELEQAHLCLGTVAPPISSEDRYTASVLNNVLGGGLSSRLFQNVREKHGLTYVIFSSLNLYLDAGMLMIYAAAAKNSVPRVLALILEECRKLCEQPVDDEELGRSKQAIKGALVLGLETTSSHMTQLAQQEIYFQRNVGLEEVLRKVDEVTKEDILRLAREMFDNRLLSATVIGNMGGVKLAAPRL